MYLLIYFRFNPFLHHTFYLIFTSILPSRASQFSPIPPPISSNVFLSLFLYFVSYLFLIPLNSSSKQIFDQLSSFSLLLLNTSPPLFWFHVPDYFYCFHFLNIRWTIFIQAQCHLHILSLHLLNYLPSFPPPYFNPI